METTVNAAVAIVGLISFARLDAIEAAIDELDAEQNGERQP